MSSVAFIPDGEVRARPTDLFPATTPADWQAHADLLDTSGRLVAGVGSFLVRSGDHIALVDLGLGELDMETPAGASYRGGDLIANLAAAGVAPVAVDLVVYTHLHRDHVGWTSSDGLLTFANARHVVHEDEWEHWQHNPSPVGPDRRTVLDVLRDRIEFCADGDELADGLRVIATPGHTPGHLSVAAGSVVIAGDVLHSPAQLHHPDWCFGSDHDPVRAAASRRLLLDRYGPDVLACGHFTRC
ncbi:MBL fold metallo-hydrolase [Labedaea rhizosphaerae]|uniref:Glyoxylase-like metal-dependent hydrolase (Beta-lactamase superfamily II) n=1 Tax=Labedaea rhizosphaerae TaxID=598644 RepID=A0A4R6SFC0_LABRH|nr:MBL fold metallo-hydrolase [Labedaea rhizosphaerae]TDQ00200.1 glyoxylase-like metal-dependent hydrolase (beta-lactamase superfamily II) [Labedaea rhizosphaerae]